MSIEKISANTVNAVKTAVAKTQGDLSAPVAKVVPNGEEKLAQALDGLAVNAKAKVVTPVGGEKLNDALGQEIMYAKAQYEQVGELDPKKAQNVSGMLKELREKNVPETPIGAVDPSKMQTPTVYRLDK